VKHLKQTIAGLLLLLGFGIGVALVFEPLPLCLFVGPACGEKE
jgi:hypothetical protein